MDDRNDKPTMSSRLSPEERARIDKDLELRQKLRDEFCSGHDEEDEPEFGHPRETLTMYR